MKTWMRDAIAPRLSFVGLGLVLGVLSTVTFAVLADGDPTTDDVPRLLPYHGTLESNGQPVNAVGEENAIAMRFALYDGAEAEVPVYVQDVEVEVFAGRFTTAIGPVGVDAQGEEVSVEVIVQAADDLHLGLTLLIDDGDDIVLSNRQRIHATPYAMWAASSTNLDVARDLLVGRNANVGGDLVVGGDVNAGRDLTVANNLEVENDLNVADDLDIDGTATINALNVTDGLQAQTGGVRVFGAWSSSFSFNRTYTAPADGFVVAYGYRTGARSHIRLDGFTPENVLRARDYGRVEAGDVSSWIMMPVRQGDSWRVNQSGGLNSSRVSYLRLGN